MFAYASWDSAWEVRLWWMRQGKNLIMKAAQRHQEVSRERELGWIRMNVTPAASRLFPGVLQANHNRIQWSHKGLPEFLIMPITYKLIGQENSSTLSLPLTILVGAWKLAEVSWSLIGYLCCNAQKKMEYILQDPKALPAALQKSLPCQKKT